MDRRKFIATSGVMAALVASAGCQTDNRNSQPEQNRLGEGGYDTIVKSTSSLENTFKNLTHGETVYITQPATPYRPGGWLDIDVDAVTVIGENQFSENGEPMIKTGDNSCSGGFRVGFKNIVSDVRITGVGFDGNKDNNPGGVRNHGFNFLQAERCLVENCHATRLFPYHQHGSGGSGISAGPEARYIEIKNNWIDDTGDRGIQVAGRNHRIIGNHCSNGFDRSIALTLQAEERTTNKARGTFAPSNVIVANNIGHDNSSGSIIGFANAPGVHENYIITGNIGYGNHRSVITSFTKHTNEEYRNVIITNNHALGKPSGDNVQGIRIGRNNKGKYRNITISNNHVQDRDPSGIEVRGDVRDVTITGNTVENVAHHRPPWVHGPSAGIQIQNIKDVTVSNNVVHNSGRYGIFLGGQNENCIISSNRLRGSGDNSIYQNGNYNLYLGNIVEKPIGGNAGPNSESVANITH